MNVQHEHVLFKQGQYYAGKHLLLDIIGSSLIEDIDLVEKSLEDSARAAGATVLHSSFHRFPKNSGFSGVCVLAESHISIHTWPEFRYAAIDIFMCGAADPYVAVKYLKRVFDPDEVKVTECARGLGCIGEVA